MSDATEIISYGGIITGNPVAGRWPCDRECRARVRVRIAVVHSGVYSGRLGQSFPCRQLRRLSRIVQAIVEMDLLAEIVAHGLKPERGHGLDRHRLISPYRLLTTGLDNLGDARLICVIYTTAIG